ncbi:MAG: hypothetical protein RLY20_417 [Verrucomicrobiota bacterium]|jgi:tetratricopeptide (TPR) repeat protein
MYGLHLLLHMIARALGDRAVTPFVGVIDGSNEPVEHRPLYSTAEARRKQGHYREAREIVRFQLLKFPNDYQGQMLLAEIEAKDLNDLAAAEVVIQRLVAQKVHKPAAIFSALCTLADWQLKYARDSDAAARCFEQVAAMYPGTEWAVRAAQRIAHLPTNAMLGDDSFQRVNLPHLTADAGLAGDVVMLAPEHDYTAEAARLVKQLEDFPLDWEAREQLALIYARDYQRLDLAEAQLEELLQFPNQPPKQLVRWLNMLADFNVKCGGSYEAAHAALQRIVDLNPKAGAASVAQNRIARLKLEFKGQEKSQAVTLGSYEDDLGLKNKPRA